MTDLNTKASAVSIVIFAVMALIFHVAPINSSIINVFNVLEDSMVIVSALIYLVALEKKGYWALFNWIRSAGLLPFFSIMLLVMLYLTTLSSEMVWIWGLPLLPVLMATMGWIGYKLLKNAFKELLKHPEIS